MLNMKINVPKRNIDVMGVKFNIQNGRQSPSPQGYKSLFLLMNIVVWHIKLKGMLMHAFIFSL